MSWRAVRQACAPGGHAVAVCSSVVGLIREYKGQAAAGSGVAPFPRSPVRNGAQTARSRPAVPRRAGAARRAPDADVRLKQAPCPPEKRRAIALPPGQLSVSRPNPRPEPGSSVLPGTPRTNASVENAGGKAKIPVLSNEGMPHGAPPSTVNSPFEV
jgi:hypothetical protein